MLYIKPLLRYNMHPDSIPLYLFMRL